MATVPGQKTGFLTKVQNFFRRGFKTATPSGQTKSENDVMASAVAGPSQDPTASAPVDEPEYLNEAAKPQKDLLQLVSLQKASGCWELDAPLADVFGKTEDELTNQKPAQVDGSVWATLLALIWLYGCKTGQQDEWQFVAMKAASWISSQNVGDLSECVCVGNVLLGCQVTGETLGI